MRQLRDLSRVRRVHPTEATIEPGREIVIGDFVDVERPTYNEVLEGLERRAAE